MTAAHQWHLRGEYFENCNCEVLCPCLLPGRPQDPTEGHCDMAFAFHVEEGECHGVPLNGLNFVVVMYVPGKMSGRCFRAVDLLSSNRGREPPTRLRRAMMTQVLHCPYCQGTDIVRHGTSPEGKQRYCCRECLQGRGRTFLLD